MELPLRDLVTLLSCRVGALEMVCKDRHDLEREFVKQFKESRKCFSPEALKEIGAYWENESLERSERDSTPSSEGRWEKEV